MTISSPTLSKTKTLLAARMANHLFRQQSAQPVMSEITWDNKEALLPDNLLDKSSASILNGFNIKSRTTAQLKGIKEYIDLYEALDNEMFDEDDIDTLVASSLSMLGTTSYQEKGPLDFEAISYGQFIEGLTQLTTSGIAEITDIVSALHCEILLRPIGRFDKARMPQWQASIIGRAYGLVRSLIMTVGSNITYGVQTYNTKLDSYNRIFSASNKLSYRLKLLLNGLNGILGDHLVNQGNVLAIKMALYNQKGELQNSGLSGRVVVLVHGLSMSHLGWHAGAEDGLGTQILMRQPESTVLYLDYNTGQRISKNGHAFTELLDELVKKNPDITQIDIVGHSMGGLVSRSAFHYGLEEGHQWVDLAVNFVTIGSPHHGALLERMSKYILDLLGELPFAGSLAKIGDVRSAGIIDLRHGSVHDDDWKSLGKRDLLPEEFLHPTVLPKHVSMFAVAGTLVGEHYDSTASDAVGDGLVSIESALGEKVDDDDVRKVLPIPPGHKATFYGVGHLNLLYNERVHKQIIDWLADNGNGSYSLESAIHSFEDHLGIDCY